MNEQTEANSKDLDPAQCGSCGHFAGAAARCPYCGAEVKKRLSLRLTRFAALLLSTVGLLLLYLMAVHREIPLVKIASISPASNFAYLRIDGQVVGRPRVFRDGARITGLRFTVNDGTGTLDVSAYGPVARKLEHRLPESGDAVSVCGSLSVADVGTVLRLQVAEQFKIIGSPSEKKSVQRLSVLEILALPAGQWIEAELLLNELTHPKTESAPYRLNCSDESGSITVVYWRDHGLDLQQGKRYLIAGQTSSYRGKPQLKLQSIEELPCSPQ